MPPKNPDDYKAVVGLYVLFAALGLPLWWETSRFALIVTPQGLDCQSPWRGRQFIAREDIEELAFSSINQWFIVKARYGQRFRVSVFVNGVSGFLAESVPVGTSFSVCDARENRCRKLAPEGSGKWALSRPAW